MPWSDGPPDKNCKRSQEGVRVGARRSGPPGHPGSPTQARNGLSAAEGGSPSQRQLLLTKQTPSPRCAHGCPGCVGGLHPETRERGSVGIWAGNPGLRRSDRTPARLPGEPCRSNSRTSPSRCLHPRNGDRWARISRRSLSRSQPPVPIV